jgi:hypothetical protein
MYPARMAADIRLEAICSMQQYFAPRRCTQAGSNSAKRGIRITLAMAKTVCYRCAIYESYLDTSGGSRTWDGVRGTPCWWYKSANPSSIKLNTNYLINGRKQHQSCFWMILIRSAAYMNACDELPNLGDSLTKIPAYRRVWRT